MRPISVSSIVLVICLMVALVSSAGCLCGPIYSASPAPSASLEPAADPAMGQIDADLARGPVFVDFGATWCEWCVKEKPVIDHLTSEYPGITFYSVDVDNDTDLARAFYVGGIPQMNVIVKKNADGSYLYMGPSGQPTGDRKKSAIIGYTESDQLEPVLNASLDARK